MRRKQIESNTTKLKAAAILGAPVVRMNLGAVGPGEDNATVGVERSIAAFESHPTPVVILRNGSYGQFRSDYPLLDAYFVQRYRLAGVTGFGDPDEGSDGYRVLVRDDGRARAVDPASGLPCLRD